MPAPPASPLAPEDLREIHRSLVAESPHVLPFLRRNVGLVDRARSDRAVDCRRPIRNGTGDLERPPRRFPVPPPPVVTPERSSACPRQARPRRRVGGGGDRGGLGADGRVPTTAVGPGDVIVACPPSTAMALGCEVGDLTSAGRRTPSSGHRGGPRAALLRRAVADRRPDRRGPALRGPGVPRDVGACDNDGAADRAAVVSRAAPRRLTAGLPGGARPPARNGRRPTVPSLGGP